MDTTYWTRGAVTRRRFLRTSVVAGGGLAAAALVGCGTSGGGAKPSAPAASKDAAAPSGPTVASITGKNFGNRDDKAVPRYGGTLNYAPGSPTLANLDPLTSTSAMVHNVATHSYSTLLLGSRPVDDKNGLVLYPDLATSWEVANPLKMTFKLREGVKFHNVAPVNGRPMTSEDVKYSIMRTATDKISLFRGAYAALKDVETPDANTVVVNLKSFDPNVFPNFGNQVAWVVPKELVDASKIREQMIGTGPWVFQKWEQDSRIAYKKNPDFYIKGAPFYDELNLLQMLNEDTRTAALQSGQVATGGIPAEKWPSMKGDPNLVTENGLTVAPYVLFMNYKEDRWKDDRVRKAVALSVDPEVILKLMSNGEGMWRGVISNQHSGWSLSQEELKSKKYFMRYDAAEAKALMSAAGFPNGISAGLLYSSTYPQNYQDATQYMIQNLTKNGIVNVKPVGQELATMRKNQDEHNYDGLCFGLDGQGTPEAFLLDYRTGGPKNGSGISDKDLDKSIDEVLATVDTKERQAKAKTLQSSILEKVLWKKAFIDSVSHEGSRKNFKNYVSLPPFWYRTPFQFTWQEG